MLVLKISMLSKVMFLVLGTTDKLVPPIKKKKKYLSQFDLIS